MAPFRYTTAAQRNHVSASRKFKQRIWQVAPSHALLATVSASLEEVAGLSLQRATEAVKCSKRRVLIGCL